MPIELNNIWVYRIIAFGNLDGVLKNGLYCKSSGFRDPNYTSIASQEIIDRRDKLVVKCYPGTMVNDYIPFYFSVRMPMLYNIHTGKGVDKQPQENIVYLCCKLEDLATDKFQWCFTDGNAAVAFSKYSTRLDSLERLDWTSIHSTDFRIENADGDRDRIRKKQAEFLVKTHVPANYIRVIVVKTEAMRIQVETLIRKLGHGAAVNINPGDRFYF